MPRNRVSYEDALAAVKAELNARPDKKLLHRDLLAVIASKGLDQVADQIPAMSARGDIVMSVDAVVAGRPAVTVTLAPGG